MDNCPEYWIEDSLGCWVDRLTYLCVDEAIADAEVLAEDENAKFTVLCRYEGEVTVEKELFPPAPADAHVFTFCTADWERIRRALTVYAASLQADKSEAAQLERDYANALAADITFKL